MEEKMYWWSRSDSPNDGYLDIGWVEERPDSDRGEHIGECEMAKWLVKENPVIDGSDAMFELIRIIERTVKSTLKMLM